MIWQSTLCSLVVTVCFVVAVIDTAGGDTTGGIYILLRHSNLKYLEDANAHIRASSEWVDILKNLELTGRRLETVEIVFGSDLPLAGHWRFRAGTSDS